MSLEVVKLVESALWIAAIDTVPIEKRAETVEHWMHAVDVLDLWRIVKDGGKA